MKELGGGGYWGNLFRGEGGMGNESKQEKP